MLPVYYTTTNTRKRKAGKKTQSQLAAERDHEKFLKKMGVSETKQPKPKRSLKQVGSASANSTTEGQRFESSNSDQFYNPTMAKKPEKVYTGTEIIGIAQMHKSNAVPIRGKKQAEEVANMRRG